jgi:hypothetical protein
MNQTCNHFAATTGALAPDGPTLSPDSKKASALAGCGHLSTKFCPLLFACLPLPPLSATSTVARRLPSDLQLHHSNSK